MLREDRSQIPAFVEETLRMESPVKCHFRMARTTTSIGDVEIPAGSTVMLLPGASNRDARKFERAQRVPHRPPQCARACGIRPRQSFLPGRTAGPRRGPNLAEPHTRPDGGHRHSRRPKHGPSKARRYTYDPTWQMRGLSELHLEFTPISVSAHEFAEWDPGFTKRLVDCGGTDWQALVSFRGAWAGIAAARGRCAVGRQPLGRACSRPTC